MMKYLNEVVIDDEIENDVTVYDIQFFHPYAMANDKKPNEMHHCPDCDYKTSKKSNLKSHQAVYCKVKQVRDIKCPICDKLFLYDELRGHLRHFATGKHKAKNEHAKYTPDEHQMILEEVKKNKKN